MRHICWDACMLPNAVMEDQQTWNAVPRAPMVKVPRRPRMERSETEGGWPLGI